MSLLLEALKKAEKAKEEAQRRARGESEASVDPAPAPVAEPVRDPAPESGAPVLTRDKLPDIHQPLEILDDNPTPKPAARAEPTLALAEERPPAASTEPRPRPSAADAPAAEREAQRSSARKVFEAKFKEPNPRLPFYITLGVLGVFAIGTVVYFWIQLRPAPALVNANPPRPADETPVLAAAPVRPAAAPAAAAPTQPAIPGLPSAPAPRTEAPRAVAPRAVAANAEASRAETPRLQTPARAAAAPRPAPPVRVQPAPEQPEISTTRPAPQVHPRIAAGYAAYQGGDFSTARAEYEQALREGPANRDALLGLAALDVRAGRYAQAEAAYLRLLQADPRDAHAHAGLIALRTGRMDALAAESRVKSMLADNPAAHVLNFTLGNQLAQQGRWAEAQQEYFKAFAAEPQNADFAYNLAVSLDHLRQSKLALEYYQRALALAKTRGASFDPAAVQGRVAQLGR